MSFAALVERWPGALASVAFGEFLWAPLQFQGTVSERHTAKACK